MMHGRNPPGLGLVLLFATCVLIIALTNGTVKPKVITNVTFTKCTKTEDMYCGIYENYVKLCNLAGKSPSAVAVELKLGKPSVTRWKHGAVPRDTTILKIAGYFGVSVEELTQDTKSAHPNNGE